MGVISIIDDSSSYNVSNSQYIIYWNTGKSGNGKTSINEYIQNNSIVIRNKYVSFINQFDKSIVGGKTILEHLDIGDGYNLWWMSTLFEKSPFKSPGIYNCLKLIALELVLSDLSYNSVCLYSRDKLLIESVDILCKDLGLLFCCIQPVSKSKVEGKNFKRFCENAFRIINSTNKTFKKLFSILIQVASTPQNEAHSNDKSLFIMSYLTNIDLPKLNEGRFYSNYWGNIQSLFEKSVFTFNWVHMYIKDNTTNSYRDARYLVKKINQSSPSASKHSILQSNLTFAGILRSFSNYIQLILKIPNNNKIKKLFYVTNSSVWLWPFLKKDWNNSVYGASAIFNLLMISTFDFLMSKIPHQKNGLYLIENQGWERAFIHAWRRYNHGFLVGVHHTVLRFWDTRFFDVNNTGLAMESLPQADLIAITGRHMREQYNSSGYNHKKLVEVEALRYMHLKVLRSKKESIKKKSKKKSNRYLILGSGNYQATQNILYAISKIEVLFDNRVSFIRHPISNDKYNFDEDVVNEIIGDNSNIIIDHDIAILPSATAASIDMHVIGMKIIIYDENHDFHLCPLFGMESIYYASNMDELSLLIKSDLVDHSRADFFWDDLSMPRWNRLLNKMGYNILL
jgi:surface carbohydrate biosynthesis protein (TIGR04326 family)